MITGTSVHASRTTRRARTARAFVFDANQQLAGPLAVAPPPPPPDPSPTGVTMMANVDFFWGPESLMMLP